MDQLLGVEEVHPAGDLPCPLDDLRREDLRALLDHFIQGPLSAVLHYDAVVGGLGGHTPREGSGRRGEGANEGKCHKIDIYTHTLQIPTLRDSINT